MFTFGYKTKYSSIVRAVAALGIGLVMIGGTNAPETVVRIIACFLLATGIVSFAFGVIRHKKENSLLLLTINAVVDIVLALILFINPGLIAKFMVVGIGIVLLVLGAMQLLVLWGAASLTGTGSTMTLFPVLALVGGGFLLFSPFGVKVMSVIAGCLLVVYGVSELMSIGKVSKAKTAYEIKYAQKPASESPVPDALEEEVDDSNISEAKEVDFQKVD